jgi:hypothetical protein
MGMLSNQPPEAGTDLNGLGEKRTPVIGGNWKIYKDPGGTTFFFDSFRPLVERTGHCEIVICPRNED